MATAPAMRLTTVGEVGATVLRVSVFRTAGSDRTFLAEADGFDLIVTHTQQHQNTTDSFRTTLAQGEVVLAAATFVGIAFDDHLLLRIAGEVAGVHFYYGAILLADRVAVEIKV